MSGQDFTGLSRCFWPKNRALRRRHVHQFRVQAPSGRFLWRSDLVGDAPAWAVMIAERRFFADKSEEN